MKEIVKSGLNVTSKHQKALHTSCSKLTRKQSVECISANRQIGCFRIVRQVVRTMCLSLHNVI